MPVSQPKKKAKNVSLYLSESLMRGIVAWNEDKPDDEKMSPSQFLKQAAVEKLRDELDRTKRHRAYAPHHAQRYNLVENDEPEPLPEGLPEL